MKNESAYKILYKKISSLVNYIDPAALGGAEGEYDKEVDQIIRLIMSKKEPLTTEKIRLIFTENFKELSLNDAELKRIVSEINSFIKEI